MFAALHPLLDSHVDHWHTVSRDVFGDPSKVESSRHAARVLHTPATLLGMQSQERMANATAVIWLLNHPHMIKIGDIFTLPNRDELKVIRWENRTAGNHTVSKVYLS